MANFKLDLDLLSNPVNFMKKKSLPTDDNEEIIRLIKDRMSLGKQRYGHGVIIDEDTTKYGTNTDRPDLSTLEWLQHLQEELMDGAVYIERLKQDIAHIEKLPEGQEKYNEYRNWKKKLPIPMLHNFESTYYDL